MDLPGAGFRLGLFCWTSERKQKEDFSRNCGTVKVQSNSFAKQNENFYNLNQVRNQKMRTQIAQK